MGNSSSTRRIVVEEDEKQGAFLVQVSDSVTQQIYGGKEPAGRVAKKPIEPLHKAVEAAPVIKPALPIQAFPAIPLSPPSLESAAAEAVAAITAAPEPPAKAEEKPAPADAAAGAETEAKKPEDDVAPEAAAVASIEEPGSAAVASTEEPGSAAAGPAEEEAKPVEEITPVSPPDESGAAAAESSVDQVPLPPPKIPQSALLQLLTPSLPPPTEPEAPAVKEEAPAVKEAPVAEESPAVKEEAPVALVTPSIFSEERELLYKQMGEVYRERDKALKAIENFYRERMNGLQNQSTKMHSATRQEFNKAVEEVEKKFLKHVESPVAEDLQLKVLDCYRVNKAYPLKCSAEVQAFSSAVDQARQDVILAKKG